MGNKQWGKKFNAITNLRILNKYHQGQIYQIFQLFWPDIQQSFNKGNTQILKNIILFLREVFINAKQAKLHGDIIKGVIPLLITQSVLYKNKCIKEECERIMSSFVLNCL